MSSYKELNAPDLVKQWHKIVNSYVSMGRDAHLIKEFLQGATPVQVLLGMYQYKNVKTITIPIFLRQKEQWIVLDEVAAQIELAVCITETQPPAYWIWQDMQYEENAESHQQYLEALRELMDWSDRILN